MTNTNTVNTDMALESQAASVYIGFRSRRILREMGLKTVGDLSALKYTDLAAKPGVGEKTIRETEDLAAAAGISLLRDDPKPKRLIQQIRLLLDQLSKAVGGPDAVR